MFVAKSVQVWRRSTYLYRWPNCTSVLLSLSDHYHSAGCTFYAASLPTVCRSLVLRITRYLQQYNRAGVLGSPCVYRWSTPALVKILGVDTVRVCVTRTNGYICLTRKCPSALGHCCYDNNNTIWYDTFVCCTFYIEPARVGSWLLIIATAIEPMSYNRLFSLYIFIENLEP